MNFICSLHIGHFIDMEIFLAIRHEVMFIREEDFPTCKLGKLREPIAGGRGGGLTFQYVKWAMGSKLTFPKWERWGGGGAL